MASRSRFSMAVLGLVAALVLAPLAAAHAELSPKKAKAGSEKKFVLSVENEQADASTVKVAVQFPESVVTATFAQTPGWTRTVTTKPLATPVVGPDGEEITERIDTVTWEGGSIGPDEVGEFGFSFTVPAQPGATIFFPTVQTYSNGDVVRWIGAPGSDEPAPGVGITQPAAGETTTTEPEPVTTTVATTVTTVPETTTADTTTLGALPASSGDDGSSWPIFLALVVLLGALGGLGYLLYRRYKQNQEPPDGDGPKPSHGFEPPPDEQLTQRIDPPDRPA